MKWLNKCQNSKKIKEKEKFKKYQNNIIININYKETNENQIKENEIIKNEEINKEKENIIFYNLYLNNTHN